ncbi:hypothetical protein ACX93W_20255 [Paenibacillus sp. CAU 1782]
MKMMRQFSKLSVCMLLAMVMMVTPMVSAAANGFTVAKTSAPPEMMQPFGMVNGYTYLLYTAISVYDNPEDTGNLEITGTTYAKSVVDELGAKIQLQRWTGTEWVNSGTETTVKKSNAEFFAGSTKKSASAGYYYRAQVTHYAKHGTTTELSVAYSGTVLKK